MSRSANHFKATPRKDASSHNNENRYEGAANPSANAAGPANANAAQPYVSSVRNAGHSANPSTNPASRNPYLQAQRSHTKAQREDVGFVTADKGFVSARPLNAAPHARRGLSRRQVIALAGSLTVAAVAIPLGWNFLRPVEIIVNGARRTFNVGTALTDIIGKEKKLKLTAGNFINVLGKVIEKGKGDPYSVKIGDKELSFDEVKGYKIHGGETIVVGNGKDVMEEYTAEKSEVAPKLKMDGAWGSICYISQWGKPEQREVRTGKVSGERSEGNVVQKGQDCVVKIRNMRPKDGKKLVAITFDDGPSKYTERYLQILKDRNVKATFFNIGNCVHEMPNLTKKVLEAGHEVMSHSYTHPVLSSLPQDKLLGELKDTQEALKKAADIDTTMLRPPYGAFKKDTWLKTQGCISASILWNMDSLDWKRPGVDKIVQNSIQGIQPGYVILMHDGGGPREQDLEALPKILDTLLGQGFEFVTITELMKADGKVPEEIISGKAKMPEGAVWPTELA